VSSHGAACTSQQTTSSYLVTRQAPATDPRITERRNLRTANIDLATSLEIVDLMNAEDRSVADAVAMLVRELGDVPLIGFAGAPFTLASFCRKGRARARNKIAQGPRERRPALRAVARLVSGR